MGTRLREVLMQQLGTLRYEPIDKRIRARVGDRTIVDSERALLVWEPGRIVPSYAVPAADVDAELLSASASEAPAMPPDAPPRLGDRAVLDPSVPFAVHTADGEPLTVATDGAALEAAAFRPADAALDDHVVLDFAAFDAWFEEDEPNVSHPRDPFHRIDVLRSTRHVRVELDGALLAESTRPLLLFEPPLPVRYYLPREDVRTALLQASDTRTACAYKGHASYFAAGGDDVAWTYLEPLHDALDVAGRIAFFNERVDLTVDGRRLERPITPWSRR